MPITVNLAERTVTGTSRDDGIRWRTFGLLWSPNRKCWVWPDNRHPATVTRRANEIRRTVPDVEVVGVCDPGDVDRVARAEQAAARHATRPTATVDVRDVLRPGDVAVCDSKDGRTTRSNTVTKINRTTFSWAELGCSGTVKLDRITAVIRNGETIWGGR